MQRKPDLHLQRLEQERKLKISREEQGKAEEEILNGFIEELYTIERTLSDHENFLRSEVERLETSRGVMQSMMNNSSEGLQ
jgi:hypothetical protein